MIPITNTTEVKCIECGKTMFVADNITNVVMANTPKPNIYELNTYSKICGECTDKMFESKELTSGR